MPSLDKLTLGEIANMRDRLIRARQAFGDDIDPGFPPAFVNPPRPKRFLKPQEQAVLDIACILERIIS